MKHLIFFAILVFLTNSQTFAQAYKKIEVETNQVINLDADDSWSTVQDWENLHKLVPEVVERTELFGQGIESKWDIYLSNGGIIKEKMIYFNQNEKTMSYIMTETPMPIQNYLAIIKVEPYGINKSLVSFYTSCEVDSENEVKILNAFTAFQKKYLSNIEKQKNEK